DMTTYSDGTKVADHLKDSTYAELSAYCVSNRVPLALLEHFKPGMLMVTIGLMELMKLGVTQQGVDMVYHQRAVADRKTIKELETIDEQISYIASMVDGCEDEFVTYSLRDMRNIKSQFDDLVSAWRKGDSERLGDMLMAELKTTVPGLYEKLVLARNKNWLPMMEGFAGTPEVEFVLVGVAHLVGPDSVIEALSKKGYKVEKLKIPAGQ
ncbi:MAG: TraB/GumN family protein, partial [bacterium]